MQSHNIMSKGSDQKKYQSAKDTNMQIANGCTSKDGIQAQNSSGKCSTKCGRTTALDIKVRSAKIHHNVYDKVDVHD